MSRKLVSFSAHKSQIERSRRKTLRKEMCAAASGINNSANIVSYSIVALSDDGRAFCAWDTGGAVPMWAFPQTMASVIKCDMDESGIDEDYKKPLIDRSWKGNK